MSFTDHFIQRPVMAISVSLLILILGLQALFKLPVRQFPEMTNTTITVDTGYYGASSDVIQGFLTQPLQQAIAEADNIDYLLSTSSLGRSHIKAVMKTGTDPNTALIEIMSKVNGASSALPSEAREPVIQSSTGEQAATMYISFTSNQMTRPQITDYLNRNVEPRLLPVPGVSSTDVYGPELAMRIWLDPVRIAQHGLSAAQVTSAISANNRRAAAGQIKGLYNLYNITIDTDLKTAQEFQQLVISQSPQGLVRLRDIADIEFAALNASTNASMNGDSNVVLAINTTPSANPLDVAKAVKQLLPQISNSLPPDMQMQVAYDVSVYIESAIDEVLQTITEAVLIVIVVIFLFMGSVRAMLIPVITIPFSLIGVCLVMQGLGFSLNLLTLLAMVLAIGLVVDDAIVVVENIQRLTEKGHPLFEAAVLGTREIASPIIVMTITLAAVFTPIALLGGITGALFKEFALTLAGAVVVSGIVALTLSPVMCAHILKSGTAPTERSERPFEKKLQHALKNLDGHYTRWLFSALQHRNSVILFALLAFLSLPFLLHSITSTFAPDEDQGVFMVMASAPRNVNMDFVDTYMKQYSRRIQQIDGITDVLTLSGIPDENEGFGFIVAKPWEQRGKNESMAALKSARYRSRLPTSRA